MKDDTSTPTTEVEPDCRLEDVIITDQLARRPSRAPDYEAESAALSQLARELAERPEGILQALTDLIVERGWADSAGISIDTVIGGERRFFWEALSGKWAGFKGGTMPFDASPCGVVVDRNAMILFEHPERFFPDTNVEPLIEEVLLVPFGVAGRIDGTLWINAHSPSRKFDREDARLMESLARFASAGFQTVGGLRRQTKSQAALHESEQRYRHLFETMGQAYVLGEVVRSPEGGALDLRLLELNPAYERLMGVSAEQARGRGIYELLPDIDRWWLETCDRVARSGRSERVEQQYNEGGVWFEAWLYPRDGDRIEALFEDVSERKRAEMMLRASEERQAFLLRFSDALREEADADAIAYRAIGLVSEHLQLDRCYIAVYRPEEDAADFPYQVGNDSVPALPDTVRLSDFPDAYSLVRRKTFVINDDFKRVGLVEAEAENSKRLGMRAMIASTARRGSERPLSSFVAVSALPRQWTTSEINLIEEAAERTWAAIESARAETALRESEADLEAELRDTTLLRDLAARLVTEESLPAIYEEILTAAIEITGARAGTVQMFDEENEELVVLATRGFGRETEEYFHRVDAGSQTSCGLALRTGTRSYFDFDPADDDPSARLHVQDGVLSAQSTPLLSRSGTPIGMVSTHWGEAGHRMSERELRFIDLLARQAADLIEQRRASAILRKSGERLRLIVENARDYAIFTTDPAGIVTDWHEGAEAVFGFSREEIVGLDGDILFVPEDRGAGAPEDERAIAAECGKAPDVRWHLRKDGSRVFIDGISTVLKSPEGRVIGFLKIGQDTTERHAADERQKLLLAELQHRVRNTLGMIRSMVRFTAEGHDDIEDYLSHLTGRLDTLSRTQQLLTRSPNTGADLHELVSEEMTAQAGGRSAYEVDGPPVTLSAKAAEVLSLALHELVTNSVKYGVLGQAPGIGGVVRVRWQVVSHGAQDWLELRWREPVTQALESGFEPGFGTELITERVPYELRGKASLDIGPREIEAHIDFPLTKGASLLETGAPR